MIPRMITVHCSDTPNGRITTVEDIRRWHMDPPPKGRGWTDIGYHFVIYTDGSVHPGRAPNIEGAHVEGHNEGNLGICMVGKTAFSPDQWDALKGLAEHLQQTYSVPIDQVHAHYEWDTAQAEGKTCPNVPGPVIRAWISDPNAGLPAEFLYQVPGILSGEET